MANSTKYIVIKYDPLIDTSTTILSRQFTDLVSSALNVSVSYNGQRIPLRTTENVSSVNSFSKFYYELSGIGTSTLTITIKTNLHYRPIGLATSEGTAVCSFTPTDLFYVDYTYTF